jgi:hypothetical protein
MEEGRTMRETPKEKEVYEHFKGYRYQILTIARNEETEKDMVVYQETTEPYQTFVCDLEMFLEQVDSKKYPETKQKYRFEKCEVEETIHPKLSEFLDADTYEKKLEILVSMEPVITNAMINTMEMALDVSISGGELEERYDALLSSLRTLKRYECNRFR